MGPWHGLGGAPDQPEIRSGLLDGGRDASALAISRNHVAVVRRGEVRLLRRDDRSTWAARSFHRDSRIGIGIGHRSGDPPPPPSSVLVVQRDDRFGLSDPAASPFVTVFGAREVPMLELTSELWR